MKECRKCGKIGVIVKPGAQCRKCVTTRQNDWANKKKNRKCVFCGKAFIPNSAAKGCSVKCRLLSNVEKNGNCWEWKGKKQKAGYGNIRINKITRLVHRVSYEEFKGEIPKGYFVCHTCDNPKCFNPEHLWLGTSSENSLDAIKKGRRKPPNTKGRKYAYRKKNINKKGEAHHLNKLNNEKVYEIREMIKKQFKQKYIAEKYGVSRGMIYRIKHGQSWSHI